MNWVQINIQVNEDFRYIKIHIFALRWRDEIIRSSQCKYVNFDISKIFIHLDVYLYPIHGSAPSWLVSSIGRGLHRYRRGHGFKSRTGLNFFQVLFTTTRFCSVLSCEDLIIS